MRKAIHILIIFCLLVIDVSARTQPCLIAEELFNGPDPCGNWTEDDPSAQITCDTNGIVVNAESGTPTIKYNVALYPAEEAYTYNWSVCIWAYNNMVTNYGSIYALAPTDSTTNNDARYVMFYRTSDSLSHFATPQNIGDITQGTFNIQGTHYTEICQEFYTNNSMRTLVNGTQWGFNSNMALGQTDASRNKNMSWFRAGADSSLNSPIAMGISSLTVKNDSCTPPIDNTSLFITGYSDQGASCVNWNTNPSNPCTTSDITPTLYFNTSKAAYCAIATNSLNYTEMGSSKHCTSGEGAIEHACDLKPEDELVYEDSIVYISCKDSYGNMNKSGESTSGPLSLNITGVEDVAKESIESGIRSALQNSYSVYTGQKIYARNSANGQHVGTFDKVVKKLNKIWAFNRIGISESHVNMFNITPVLYTLEFANKTSAYIENQTALLINSTK